MVSIEIVNTENRTYQNAIKASQKHQTSLSERTKPTFKLDRSNSFAVRKST